MVTVNKHNRTENEITKMCFVDVRHDTTSFETLQCTKCVVQIRVFVVNFCQKSNSFLKVDVVICFIIY